MKRKLTYFLAASTLFAIACHNNKTVDPRDSTKTPESPTELRDSAVLDYETAKRYVKNYEAHAGFVDTTSGHGPQDDYKEKRPDTRCIWFSAARLEKMLAELKKEKGDGIRFYLATYNKKYDDKWDDDAHGIKPPRDHWGYNTLIMVPTKDSIAGNDHMHRDYFYSSSVIAASNKKTVSTAYAATASQLQNRGELCPPPKGCKSLGALLLEK